MPADLTRVPSLETIVTTIVGQPRESLTLETVIGTIHYHEPEEPNQCKSK
jgi:hypothetical protein